MNDKQRTIKAPVQISGVGLHTGREVTMTFRPAPVNHGYKFKRIDLPEQPVIDASVDNVIDVSRGTTIGVNGTVVRTVEHALAALAGLRIDNVLMELDAPEPPVMDGSSMPFIDALQKTGTVEQEAEREYFDIDQTLLYNDPQNNVDIAALPLNDFRVTVMIDYNSPVLGSQHATMVNLDDFPREFASSRTFCFLHELEMLLEQGLIKGGDLNNAIVVVDRVVHPDEMERLAKLFRMPKVEVKKSGILNNVKLRYRNEPARHKLLDLVGDLALIGTPLRAQILAARPGHASNIAFAKKIKALITQWKGAQKYQPKKPASPSGREDKIIFDVNAIQKILPHRYPFLLVDKILSMDEHKIVGLKNVTINEPFFQGHFPGDPIMPGVLQLEAMAQVGGIWLLNKLGNPKNVRTYFLGIDNVRFKKPVLPGDQLIMELELTNLKRNVCKMKGTATVNGALVCEAELIASVVNKTE